MVDSWSSDGMNVTKEKQAELAEAIGDAPLYVMVNLIAQQVSRLNADVAFTKTIR
jgi:hypothetical protein